MADRQNADQVARILSLAALNGSQTEKKITVAQDVGGIKAGTVYNEGTSVTTIINDLLNGQAPEVDVTIYVGATTQKPTSTALLTSKVVSSTELIGTYTINIKAGDEGTKEAQYPIFAVPTTYSATKWCADGFPYNIPHTKIVKNGYNIYYLNNPSYDEDLGGITYKIDIE